MGYNIIKMSHVQDPPSRDPKGFDIMGLGWFGPNNVRKPTVKDSMLIQIRETGQLEGRDYVHSKYWVEIPKEMATRILALNYLPDLNQSET